jgi:hypothetical protein
MNPMRVRLTKGGTVMLNPAGVINEGVADICPVRGRPLLDEVGQTVGYMTQQQQPPTTPGKSNDPPPLYPNPDRMIV